MSSRDGSSHDTRTKILARRAKFVAAAVASAGLVGCGSQAAVCLSLVADSGSEDGSVSDTRPQPCLDPVVDSGAPDATPEVCLSPVLDTGVETAADSTTDSTARDADSSVTDAAEDTAPMPCLSPPPPPSDAG